MISNYAFQLTLEQTPARIASEYFTKDEMVQFRKPKRKKKVRRLKADDLLGLTPESDVSEQRLVRSCRIWMFNAASVRMYSGGYCTGVCVSVCLSVKSHLTYAASVCTENAVTYSAGNEGKKICGDLPETTAFKS